MPSFNFACTGCGKCCTSAPQMTPSDMFRLYRDFPLTLNVIGMFIPGDAPAYEAREQASHMVSTLGAIDSWTDDGDRMVIRLVAAGISAPSLRRCPQLGENGQCNVYDRRPGMCRSVPLDYGLPQKMQTMTLLPLRQRVEQADWQCDLSPSAPIVWDNGKVARDNPAGEGYFAAIDAAYYDAPINEFLKSFDKLGISQDQMVQAIIAGSMIHFPAIALIELMNSSDEMAADYPGLLPSVEDFVAAQIPLMEAALADNLQRKNRDDRPSTTILRNSLAALKAAAARQPS